jgi:hypothetical protein
MNRFPQEFSQLLSRRGLSFLRKRDLRAADRFARLSTPIIVLKDMISRHKATACRHLLEHTFDGRLQRVLAPIPQELISGADHDATEALPKTMEFRTSYFENRRSRAYVAAKRVGLIGFMQSASLREFAEAVTGYSLRSHGGTQIICYEPGNSVGPHTDHHPDIPEAREGYVDVHLMFTAPAVEHQYLVYEEDRFFRRMQNVALDGAIAIYRLPFWHYSTPLTCAPNRQHDARRWLLLAGFWIVGNSKVTSFSRKRAIAARIAPGR